MLQACGLGSSQPRGEGRFIKLTNTTASRQVHKGDQTRGTTTSLFALDFTVEECFVLLFHVYGLGASNRHCGYVSCVCFVLRVSVRQIGLDLGFRIQGVGCRVEGVR